MRYLYKFATVMIAGVALTALASTMLQSYAQSRAAAVKQARLAEASSLITSRLEAGR
jgi:hypothetical protein